MTRGTRAALAAAVLAFVPGSAHAAEVALLMSSDVPAWRPVVDALRAASAGHTVRTYDLQGSAREAERVLPGLKGSAAVVVAMGPLAVQATHGLPADVPLVYCMVHDPAAAGVVDGPNVTGVAFSVPVRNQLVAFRAVNPKATRIGVVFSSPSLGRQMEEARKAASGLRLDLVLRQAASVQAVPQAIRELLGGKAPVDALWIPPDPQLLEDATRRFVMEAAVQAGKPVYSSSASLVREGALVSNSPDFVSIGQSVGELVNRIARGEKPGRLAVVVPRSEVVINKRMADQLRLSIPEEALKAAQRVF